jgi:hypothetical protein
MYDVCMGFDFVFAFCCPTDSDATASVFAFQDSTDGGGLTVANARAVDEDTSLMPLIGHITERMTVYESEPATQRHQQRLRLELLKAPPKCRNIMSIDCGSGCHGGCWLDCRKCDAHPNSVKGTA